MHTKGPWKFVRATGSSHLTAAPTQLWEIQASLGRTPVTITEITANKLSPETQANARLIAAAPELLERLEHARETISKAYDEIKHISGDWIEPLRVELIVAHKMSDDAIRKAKSHADKLKGE